MINTFWHSYRGNYNYNKCLAKQFIQSIACVLTWIIHAQKYVIITAKAKSCNQNILNNILEPFKESFLATYLTFKQSLSPLNSYLIVLFFAAEPFFLDTSHIQDIRVWQDFFHWSKFRLHKIKSPFTCISYLNFYRIEELIVNVYVHQ